MPLGVDDYLEAERAARTRHEYAGGAVYAMAGGRNAHNLVASNILGALYSRLRGKPCKAYNSDTKIRVRLPAEVRFYYPDASVVCRPNPPGDSFHDEPAVVVEVLSHATRRTDEGEKRDAYTSIPSLRAYLLVEHEVAAAVVVRRAGGGFVRELYEGVDAVVPLHEIGADLPLGEVYEGVDLVPEPDDA